MISDDLCGLIRRNFAHEPTNEQYLVLRKWEEFLLSRKPNTLFLLKGYAGTGKTSLVAALVKTLLQLKQSVMLLAPTGRAAKVFSSYADAPAYTIHKRIYRQKSIVDMDNFQTNINLHKHTLFIVDEASMISNEGLAGSMFGTGRLLDDLMQFVYSCEGCRLILVGDTAQLPPVGEEKSPALCKGVLEGYDLDVTEIKLTEVVRQEQESGILWNATHLRQLMQDELYYDFPRLRTNFPDVCVMPGDELIEALESSYHHCGMDQTIVVTRSNKRANIFNNGIRARILDYEDELSGNDLVMVAKNNYYWTERINGNVNPEFKIQNSKFKAQNSQLSTLSSQLSTSFLANGDVAVVRRFRNERELYGFRFADATLRFPDYDNMELDVTVLLDTLQSEAPALTRQQQEQLFNAVWEDYPEIRDKRERMKRLRQDPYYNALQIKYAYAVTCHKAQGGQWQHVYIDQGYVTEEMLTPDYFRWLYTALTRATEKVFLVNWPKEQEEQGC
ncbi:MAG: AAA family ATPase [Bacteroidaceae bacterium]|nr:AAA family ATPase [Bacteroidaceae bacterium]